MHRGWPALVAACLDHSRAPGLGHQIIARVSMSLNPSPKPCMVWEGRRRSLPCHKSQNRAGERRDSQVGLVGKSIWRRALLLSRLVLRMYVLRMRSVEPVPAGHLWVETEGCRLQPSVFVGLFLVCLRGRHIGVNVCSRLQPSLNDIASVVWPLSVSINATPFMPSTPPRRPHRHTVHAVRHMQTAASLMAKEPGVLCCCASAPGHVRPTAQGRRCAAKREQRGKMWAVALGGVLCHVISDRAARWGNKGTGRHNEAEDMGASPT
eukprot:360556-Chlamydomonas_euryale.AAC.1